MSSESRIYGIQSGFSIFLWKWIDRVHELRFKGDYAKALETLFELYDALTLDVKDRIKDDIMKIREQYEAPIYTPNDFFPRIVTKNKIRQKRAKHLVSICEQTIIAALDKGNYLVKRAREIETNVPKRFFEVSFDR